MKETNHLKVERHILLFDNSLEIKENENWYLMDKEMISLGRQSSADIPLKFSFISREQATIVRLKDFGSEVFRYHIFDGGKFGRSTNGIRVNGRRTLASKLKHGDVVNIGKELKFIYINFSLSDAEVTQYMSLVSDQDEIGVATGFKINLEAKKFREPVDTALKTKVLS